jgi:hypothetical protein
MPETTSPIPRLSRADWKQLMEQYEASGLKQRTFCEQHGLSLQHLLLLAQTGQEKANPGPCCHGRRRRACFPSSAGYWFSEVR